MGKIAKDKVLIRIEAINLVSRSECINQYPKVKVLIEKYRQNMKSIFLSDIEGLMQTDIDTYNILRYSFKKIQSIAAKEWSQEKFVGDYKNKCELCGNTRLLHNYRIRNTRNNQVLIVGSECINKFPSMDNKSFDSRKHRREQDKLVKETNRINLLNKKFPGCKEELDRWRKYYDNLELLMPENLDSRFNKLILESNNFYTDYIDGKYKNADVDRLADWYTEFEDLKDLSDKFILNNRADRLVVTKKMGDWLIKENLKGIRQQIIKDDAKINKYTIKYMSTSSFVNLFKDVIEKRFENFGYKLRQITDSKVIFVCRYRYSDIDVAISLVKFMNSYGAIFLGENINEETSIINNFEIDWREQNVTKFEWELNNLLKNTIYEFDLSFDENTLKVFKENYVAKLDAKVFFKNHKYIMKMKDREAKKKILDTISSIRRWELKDDINNIRSTMINRY